MAASSLSLSEGHKAQLSAYLSFCKGRRDRLSADISALAADAKSDKTAADELFNQSDVKTIIDDVVNELRDSVREETEKLANMTGAYMAQLYAASERVGVSVDADISTIEDANGIASIAALLKKGASAPVTSSAGGAKLPALGSSAAANSADIGRQLADTKEENRQLLDRFQNMQKQVGELLKERAQLQGELQGVKENFRKILAQTQNETTSADLQKQIEEAQESLMEKEAEVEELQGQMQSRLQSSSQFKDLRKIVAEKNALIKSLKARLAQYEKVSTVDDQTEEVILDG